MGDAGQAPAAAATPRCRHGINYDSDKGKRAQCRHLRRELGHEELRPVRDRRIIIGAATTIDDGAFPEIRYACGHDFRAISRVSLAEIKTSVSILIVINFIPIKCRHVAYHALRHARRHTAFALRITGRRTKQQARHLIGRDRQYHYYVDFLLGLSPGLWPNALFFLREIELETSRRSWARLF